MPQLKCSNFLVKCTRHGLDCPHLLKFAEENTPVGSRFTVHSIENCRSRCLTVQAFLLHHTEHTEAFHLHYENGSGTEDLVRKTLSNRSEFEIIVVRTPRKEAQPVMKKDSPAKVKKEEVSERKSKVVRKVKKAWSVSSESSASSSGSNSRSRSREKSNVRKINKKKQEKKVDFKKEKDQESKKTDSWVEKELRRLNEKLEEQDITIGDLKKTQVDFARKQHTMEKSQKTIMKNLEEVKDASNQTIKKVEKLEKSNDKMIVSSQKMIKSNQAVLDSNKTMTQQFYDLIAAQEKTLMSLNRLGNQNNQGKEPSRPSRENNTGFSTNYVFSSKFLDMANNGTSNTSSASQRPSNSKNAPSFDNIYNSLRKNGH